MECPPVTDYNVKVVLKMPGAAGKVYYDFKVENVDMYVFSESDGKYVDGYKQLYNTASGTEFFFNLAPGKYRFVTWVNHEDPYKVSYSHEQCLSKGLTYREMMLYFESGSDKTVRNNMPDLLFGHITDAEVEIAQNEYFVVEAIPYTNIINLTAEGLPETAGNYTLSVIDDNSHYTFDNNYMPEDITKERMFTYVRAFAADSHDKYAASMKLLRLTDPELYTDKMNPVIRITDLSTSNVVYEKDLIHIIKTSYSNNSQVLDFDKESVFNIALQFDMNMEATISVNGWNIINQPEELE